MGLPCTHAAAVHPASTSAGPSTDDLQCLALLLLAEVRHACQLGASVKIQTKSVARSSRLENSPALRVTLAAACCCCPLLDRLLRGLRTISRV